MSRNESMEKHSVKKHKIRQHDTIHSCILVEVSSTPQLVALISSNLRNTAAAYYTLYGHLPM